MDPRHRLHRHRGLTGAGGLGGLGGLGGGLGGGGLGLGNRGAGGDGGGSGIILIGDLVAGISTGGTGSGAGGVAGGGLGSGSTGPGGPGGPGSSGSGPGGPGNSGSGDGGPGGAGASPKVILARRPLAGGALAGMLGPGVRLALNDDRQSLDEAALERIAVLAARLAPLVEREPPAARSCVPARATLERGRRPEGVEALTLAELALRFVLDRGAVALPRLHRAERIPEAIAAASAPPLSQALLDRLVELVRDD